MKWLTFTAVKKVSVIKRDQDIVGGKWSNGDTVKLNRLHIVSISIFDDLDELGNLTKFEQIKTVLNDTYTRRIPG